MSQQSQQKVTEASPLSLNLVAEISIPRPADKMEYLIDRAELLDLRERKLVGGWLYVWFAIKLTYGTTQPSIDIESFCKSWEIETADFYQAIAQLHKKGALMPTVRQLKLALFDEVSKGDTND